MWCGCAPSIRASRNCFGLLRRLSIVTRFAGTRLRRRAMSEAEAHLYGGLALIGVVFLWLAWVLLNSGDE